MKNVLITGAMCLLALTAFAQANRAELRAKLTQKFPGAKTIRWDREGKDYEAAFTYQGRKMSVVMNTTGDILETETTIPTAQLPKPVRDYIAQHHRGKRIAEAAEIVDAKGVKKYEAEVSGQDLLFDEQGKKL